MSIFIAAILAAVIIIIGIVYNRSYRERFFSKPIMRWLNARMPALSQTEKEALEAGESWVEADIFQGKINWKAINDLSLSELNDDEKSFLENETVELCNLIDDWKIVNEDHDLSKEAWQQIRDKGFCGLTLSKKYGGKDFSAAAVSAIVQRIAGRSFTAAITVMVPNSLGLGELFSHFGTKEQKEKFLPDLASGKELACFALTGPETGSDASSIPDQGVVCHQKFNGKKTLGVSINFNKRYITLAPVATLIGLAFNLRDPSGLLQGTGREGITCCYLPRNYPGVSIGKRHYPCGMPIMNGPIQGENVFVPMEWIIGGQKNAGSGWSILMSALSTGRAISLPAISQGIATTQYISTSAYAAIRSQFGQSIGRFEGVQEILARVAGLTYLSNACRVFTYTAIDQGVKPAVASAIAKLHVTEIGRKVINDALDIHGGRGVMDGPKNYLTGHYRGLLISITGEGANIMTRNLIIFGQAMTRCHRYLLTLMQSAAEKDLKTFDKAFWGCVKHFVGNFFSVVWLAFTRAAFSRVFCKNELQKEAAQINYLSKVLSLVSDTAIMIVGGDLKKKERICACLADMLSYLYMGTAVIKYYQVNKTDEADLHHAKWALNYSLYETQEACLTFLKNFPNRFIATVIRFFAFPYGRPFDRASHALEAKLAKSMQSFSALRERFKSELYLDNSEIGLVESAFEAQQSVKHIRKKLDMAIAGKHINRKATIHSQLEQAQAQQVLTKEEVKKYLDYWELYWEAINVDAF